MKRPRRKLNLERIDRQVVRAKPRVRNVAWPPTFMQFLAYHREVSGPVGKVARFAMLDYRCWPRKANSRAFLWRHVFERHADDPSAPTAFDFHECYRRYYEFVASRKQIPNRRASAEPYYIVRYCSLSAPAWQMLRELCDPRLRPLAVTSRPAVIEEAIRAYHALILGDARKARQAAVNGQHPRDSHLSPQEGTAC